MTSVNGHSGPRLIDSRSDRVALWVKTGGPLGPWPSGTPLLPPSQRCAFGLPLFVPHGPLSSPQVSSVVVGVRTRGGSRTAYSFARGRFRRSLGSTERT